MNPLSMRRLSMRRFVVLWVSTLLVLVACARWSGPRLPTPVGQPSTVSLTLQTVEGAADSFVWWEAETPTATNFLPVERNPFAPADDTEAAGLSAGQWIGVEGDRDETLFLEYAVTVPAGADYYFYTRKFWKHGPFRWRWDDQPWTAVTRSVYLLDATPIRQFVVANWVSLGRVALTPGVHTLRLELTQTDGPAAFDCFALTRSPLHARGKLKPNERYAADLRDWFVFDPEADPLVESPIDLRRLNEAIAGDEGFIRVQGETLVHETTGRPERFWAVNITPGSFGMDATTRSQFARFLAKRGVNLVRIHGRLTDNALKTVDLEALDSVFGLLAAFKAEGIYTSLSLYFPLWFTLDDASGIEGYSGQHPFALLFFNPAFQERYYDLWRTVLTTVNPYTGKALRDDPALALVELVNEDSYLFWTFKPGETVPAAQMAGLEQQFREWLTQAYGSSEAALNAWNASTTGDRPDSTTLSLLPLAEILAHPESQQAQDTATFLTQSQQRFFQQTMQRLRNEMGYRGLIYASNWTTADGHLLGPLDKYSNTVADVMDRHGYFSGAHQGEAASYSLETGQTYTDRSVLWLTDPEGHSDAIALPLMDLRYNNKPSLITEVNWAMPNRYRAEFPLLAAAYGLLQGSDGFAFFATDTAGWMPRLTKFAIASPTLMGQFPAAALIYRQGLIQPGRSVVDVTLRLEDLYALNGAPITAPQNLDALRAQDVPPGGEFTGDRAQTIDPLAFLVGKVNLHFSNDTSSARFTNLSPYVDRRAKTIRSTTGELLWNYKTGLMTVNAPRVQAATGFFNHAGEVTLDQITITSNLDYGTVMLVSLDEQPIERSRQLLLQVMSVDENLGWRTEGTPRKTIQNTGTAPLVVQKLTGQIALTRQDAAALTVTALDVNGYPTGDVGHAAQFALEPNIFYYLIQGQ